MSLRGSDHNAGRQINRVCDELVRMLRLDPKRLQSLRKIPHIHSDDHIGAAAYRGCQYVEVEHAESATGRAIRISGY